MPSARHLNSPAIFCYHTPMDVLTFGNDLLRQKAAPVEDLKANLSQWQETAEKMFAALKVQNGVGLAGPEVGVGRLAVPDGGAGSARPQGRRLGVQRPDGRRGLGWPSKTGPPARPDIPFGQGLAVLFACLPRGVAGGLPRRPPEHEPQGRVLGQRVRGILFYDAEAGA